MYINRHPANILSTHIKQNPHLFDKCISELVDIFIKDLHLTIANKELSKLRTMYKFIFMYGLITSNFSTINNIMRHSMAITTIINALIINGNLKIKQHIELVYIMMMFGKNNHTVLSNSIVVTQCCTRFNSDCFYKAIRILVTKYCSPERLTY